MNDQDAPRLLERLAETFPDQPAPLTSLVTAAKQGQRRRSRNVMAMAAASVALVLGGGAVVQQVVTQDSDKPSPDKPAQHLTSDVPTAPDGMRLVGAGRVVLSVPSSWQNDSDGACRPTELDSWARLTQTASAPWSALVVTAPCEPVGYRSAMAVEQGPSLWGALPTGGEPEGITDTRWVEDEVNGVSVFRADFICPPAAACTTPDAHVVHVPSEDVTVTWVGPLVGQADVSRMAASLQLLPEGYTTVPYFLSGTNNYAAGEELDKVGLAYSITDIGVGHPITGTAPEAGSVVEVGSRVTLLYPDSNTVRVPSVVGLTVEEATAALQAVGLVGTLEPATLDTLMSVTGTVPKAGAEVAKGSTVQLVQEPGEVTDMTVSPSTAQPGDVVALNFPQSTGRGIGFTLTGPDCKSAACVPQQTYYLTSDGGGGEPSWAEPGENGGWDDIGVGGMGPDHVVIPDVASDGTYQLCTANAAKQMCAQVEVLLLPTVPLGTNG